MPLSGQGAAVTTAVLAVLTGITLISAILIAVSPRRRLLDRQSFVVGVSGLRNRGESRCYFNAVLQALAATPAFIAITTVLDNPNDGGCERNEGNEGKEDVPVVHSHDSSEPHSDRSDTPLANAMVALAISINQCDPVATASAIADRVLSEYCQQGGRFEYGEQDAQEFLVRLVEIVQTEQSAARLRRPALAAPWMIGPRGTASTSGLRPCVGGGRPGAGEGWRDPPTRGLLSSCVVCLSCSASTTEQIGEFSCVTCMLPIVGGVVSVAECLAEHFRPVLVSGYSCENCNTRGLPSSGSACKVTRAPRLPQVLVVHFSRVAAVGYKNEARIRVDATIDVGPHASAGWDSSSTQHAAAPELYTLTAVVCHIGNANSGHYVCYRRRLGVDGWVLTSDERVITVPFSTVQLAGGAYLAFYEQCPAPMVDIVADHTGVSTTPD